MESDHYKNGYVCTYIHQKELRYSLVLALAVFTRSPAAYEALRNFKLLQLLSVRTLKLYIDANIESAGDSMARLQRSWKEYKAMVAERNEGLKPGKI